MFSNAVATLLTIRQSIPASLAFLMQIPAAYIRRVLLAVLGSQTDNEEILICAPLTKRQLYETL
jgi:hypothetical protein